MQRQHGFTLIELSIVLVIIGLIIGGILTGQNLIDSAAQRAQIAQVEKYNTAVRTFQNKYGFLPGDMPNPYASQFGFQPRGAYAGEGDGNGLIEGITAVYTNQPNYNDSQDVTTGEVGTFWVDLSTAGLIDGGFNTAMPATAPSPNPPTGSVGLYMPAAKIGQGNYLYVWSGGYGYYAHSFTGDNANYFGISAPITTGAPLDNYGHLYSVAGMTVQQAYNIDKKADDGLPQSGSVMALYNNSTISFGYYAVWATGSSVQGQSTGGPNGVSAWLNAPTTAAVAYQTYNCYDNNGGSGQQTYSLLKNANVQNCALSFRFQ